MINGSLLGYHLIGPLLPIMPSIDKGPYPSVIRCPKISKEQSLEIPFSPTTPPSSSLEFVKSSNNVL
jgi:hypothetical protein